VLRSVRASAKRILALESTILKMCESVTGDPCCIFRPISTAWQAAEIFFREYLDCPFEIDHDVGQLPANLGDRNDGVVTSSIECREGIRVFLGRFLYLRRHGSAGLEESVVAFSGELRRNDVGDQGRIFRDVNARGLATSRGLSLGLLGAPRGKLVFVESTR